jgi:predicted O-methyltransferase YrrM
MLLALTPSQRWAARIEKLRASLCASDETLSYMDYGAGSPESHRSADQMAAGTPCQRRLADICRAASKPEQWGRLLFRIVRQVKPEFCLELGTCLGISAAYIGAALKVNRRGHLYSIEGAAALADVAKRNLAQLGLDNVSVLTGRFHDVLPSLLLRQYGFTFIDGHHDRDATLSYFAQILPHASGVMVFDDIHWSPGMSEAWEQIRQHPRVRHAEDMQQVGMCWLAA